MRVEPPVCVQVRKCARARDGTFFGEWAGQTGGKGVRAFVRMRVCVCLCLYDAFVEGGTQ